MTRTLLGKWTSLSSRIRVYELDDSLEVEANEQYEVTRRRVFLDDVVLVTFHRAHGVAFLIITGLIAAFFDLLAIAMLTIGDKDMIGLIMVAIPGVPATIAFAIRAIYGVDIVTVYGKRSKLALRWRVRKEQAREVYGHICAIVRQAQQKRAAEYAAEAAAFAPATTEETPPLPPAED